jgi:hypothetical protein
MRVPIIVKDLSTQAWKGIVAKDGFEEHEIANEDYFLDGPVSARVAVLDFDENTGACLPVPLTKDRKGYEHGPPPSPGSSVTPGFLSVSVFGTVHKVMGIFEESDTLGRRLTWAFDGPQLLVVPRAGEMANAFYERESRSLQFFQTDDTVRNRRVFAAASQDIVAHETGHAVLDAIAPDLYDAMTPQSLAMHEAVADLVALHCGLRYRPLSDKVLSDMGGDLGRASSTAFSVLAAELGEARDSRADYLRDISVKRGLPGARADYPPVATTKPHELSTVLSGALYCVLLQAYATTRTDLETDPTPEQDKLIVALGNGNRQHGIWRAALYLTTQRFKRFVFRALDYLPPGDATWIDLAHAMHACDAAYHPEVDALRTAFAEELVNRNVATAAELVLRPLPAADLIDGMELATLLGSDWAAYEWVGRHRVALGIPEKVPFNVRKRLDVRKKVYHRRGRTEHPRELVIKVGWEELEDNPAELAIASRRSVTRGTTVAIQWADAGDKNRVIAHITSHAANREREARDAFLLRLADEGLISRARGAASKQLAASSELYAEVADDVMTLKGGARLLHIVGDDA